jgi:hypothetical protein
LSDDFQKYRAAITKIFLWQYKAIPIFRLNPLSPGDVVQLDNETTYLSHSRCYSNLNPKPLDIQPFESGMSVSTSAGLKVKGELLTKKIAEIDASVDAKTEDGMIITVKPLSESRVPDIATLSK